MIKFPEFEKIARLSRPCVITEKLDGTNASVHILSEYQMELEVYMAEYKSPDTERLYSANTLIEREKAILKVPIDGTNWYLMAGSRTQWVWPGNDNAGFGGWVRQHAEELVVGLGEGRHYGEWWGLGIKRGYGLKEKRFSLFNTSRWNDETKPECCHVVPVLFQGLFTTTMAELQIGYMTQHGSVAAPGFMDPEGIVIYHTAAGMYFKKTIKHDESPKSMVKEA